MKGNSFTGPLLSLSSPLQCAESVSILSSFKSHWHSQKKNDVLTNISHQSYQREDTPNTIFAEWRNVKKNLKSLPKRTLSIICLTNAMFEHGCLHFKLISTHTFDILSTNIYLCLLWFRYSAIFELKRLSQVKG